MQELSHFKSPSDDDEEAVNTKGEFVFFAWRIYAEKHILCIDYGGPCGLIIHVIPLH